MNITVTTPNHLEVMSWINNMKPTGIKLRRTMEVMGLQAEAFLKSIVVAQANKTWVTGETAASILSEITEATDTKVTVAVGSKLRGSTLRWLDRGRKEVVAKRAKALQFLGREGYFIYRKRVGPTQPLNLMQQTMRQIVSGSEPILTEGLK